jgi:hypothetical protein
VIKSWKEEYEMDWSTSEILSYQDLIVEEKHLLGVELDKLPFRQTSSLIPTLHFALIGTPENSRTLLLGPRSGACLFAGRSISGCVRQILPPNATATSGRLRFFFERLYANVETKARKVNGRCLAVYLPFPSHLPVRDWPSRDDHWNGG